MNLSVNYIAGISIGVSMAIFARSLLKLQSRVWGFNYGEKDLRLTAIVVRVMGIVFIAGVTGFMR